MDVISLGFAIGVAYTFSVFAFFSKKIKAEIFVLTVLLQHGYLFVRIFFLDGARSSDWFFLFYSSELIGWGIATISIMFFYAIILLLRRSIINELYSNSGDLKLKHQEGIKKFFKNGKKFKLKNLIYVMAFKSQYSLRDEYALMHNKVYLFKFFKKEIE